MKEEERDGAKGRNEAKQSKLRRRQRARGRRQLCLERQKQGQRRWLCVMQCEQSAQEQAREAQVASELRLERPEEGRQARGARPVEQTEQRLGLSAALAAAQPLRPRAPDSPEDQATARQLRHGLHHTQHEPRLRLVGGRGLAREDEAERVQGRQQGAEATVEGGELWLAVGLGQRGSEGERQLIGGLRRHREEEGREEGAEEGVLGDLGGCSGEEGG